MIRTTDGQFNRDVFSQIAVFFVCEVTLNFFL